MTLWINTLPPEAIPADIREELNRKQVKVMETEDMDIQPCIGCNYCWLKTPGVCSIHDDYGVLLEQMAHADAMWVLSDTSFGFLSHQGKNIFDRFLPLLTMYLHFRGGQMRHVMRYDNRMNVGIIYRGQGNRDYLEQWCQRVASNLGSHSLGVYAIGNMKEAFSCIQ